jgi:hypothetical protein
MSAALPFPAFNRYYEDTKTASAPSRLRIALGVRFLGLLSLSWRPRSEGKARGLGSWFAGVIDPFRLVPWRQEALIPLRSTPAGLRGCLAAVYVRCAPIPSFPGDPITALPCSKAPGGNCGASVLPPLFLARRLPHCFTFEAQSHGFTARCLRLKAPFLDTNQGSLPVDGQSLSGGVIPPGLGRGFRLLATSFSPFGSLFGFTSALPASQGFGWRQGIFV